MGAKRRESKYHLITANFNHYDFNKLFNEENENEKILWKTGGENGKRAQNYNIGDICYIYYSELPDGTNRILLRAEVIASDTDKNIIDNIYSYDKESKIKGIRLSKIRAIALDDRDAFSDSTLLREYNKGSIQGQQYLGDIPYEGSKELELIKALEDYPHKKGIKAVREYFDNYTKCFFSRKDKKQHITFTSGRGLSFYERHHFILKNYLNKKGQDTKWLENDHNNLIHLCPNCHRQLHHGTAEDVKSMIDEIYSENQKWFDNNLKEHAKQDGYSDVLEWVYHIYDDERAKYRYELLSTSKI